MLPSVVSSHLSSRQRPSEVLLMVQFPSVFDSFHNWFASPFSSWRRTRPLSEVKYFPSNLMKYAPLYVSNEKSNISGEDDKIVPPVLHFIYIFVFRVDSIVYLAFGIGCS